MYIQSVLVLLTVLSSAVQLPPVQSPTVQFTPVQSPQVQFYKLGAMKPAFVTPAGPSAGSCSLQDTETLKASFREAVEAVQKAIGAIENLKKSAPSAIVHPDRRRTWKRQAQLLKALFNIDVDKSHPLGNNNGDVKVVQDHFQNMLDEMDYPLAANKYWLFCGDKWLQWKAPTDINVLDPQFTVGQTMGGGGAFLARVNTPAASLSAHVAISNAPTTDPVCRGGQYAGLDSLALTKSNIKLGNRLDDQLTLAHLWIHEWGHLHNRFKDEKAVDGLGRTTPEDANGWQKGVNLARFDPDRAREAPDLYALFAVAVYFDNFGWGSGVAEK
ncbi:MAG: hypothetical protein Q9178_007041 [Gyalolechia marmorata]